MKERKENTEKTTELKHKEPTTTTTTTLTPFGLMRRFAGDMEQLFEDVGGYRFSTLFGKTLLPFSKELKLVTWVPDVEVLRHDGKLKVHVDLPGLKKDEVKVEVTEGFLTISGERKEEKEEKCEGYYRTERTYGTFYRQIPLPEGAKTNTATAEFKNGVLEITLAAPKTETRTRLLEIKGLETAKAKAPAA